MVVLGLMPPYTADEVKQAYLSRVKTAHPDAGGSEADFLKLQQAFEEANAYLGDHATRWTWVAYRVEIYAKQQTLATRLANLGANVEIEVAPHLVNRWGEDFAHLADEIVAIHLHGRQFTDETIGMLVEASDSLSKLRVLGLRDTRISEAGIRQLSVLTSLRHLELRNMRATAELLYVVGRLAHLQDLDLCGTRLGWATLLRLWWSFPRVGVRRNCAGGKGGDG